MSQKSSIWPGCRWVKPISHIISLPSDRYSSASSSVLLSQVGKALNNSLSSGCQVYFCVAQKAAMIAGRGRTIRVCSARIGEQMKGGNPSPACELLRSQACFHRVASGRRRYKKWTWFSLASELLDYETALYRCPKENPLK